MTMSSGGSLTHGRPEGIGQLRPFTIASLEAPWRPPVSENRFVAKH